MTDVFQKMTLVVMKIKMIAMVHVFQRKKWLIVVLMVKISVYMTEKMEHVEIKMKCTNAAQIVNLTVKKQKNVNQNLNVAKIIMMENGALLMTNA